jgi:hypothetical protein
VLVVTALLRSARATMFADVGDAYMRRFIGRYLHLARHRLPEPLTPRSVGARTPVSRCCTPIRSRCDTSSTRDSMRRSLYGRCPVNWRTIHPDVAEAHRSSLGNGGRGRRSE